MKSNPRFSITYRYFRDIPTDDTTTDSRLREALILKEIRQHHWITDFHYQLPNRLTLFGSTTWSGNKNQKKVNIFHNQSFIGWAAGLIWPVTERFNIIFQAGNTAAGSEGGIANTDSTIYFGQFELKI